MKMTSLTPALLLFAFCGPLCHAQAEPEGEKADEKGEEADDEADKKADKKKARKKRKGDDRELDSESPEAQALAELLVRDAAYAKDGTVSIVYDFTEPTQQQDWEMRGFDLVEASVRAKGKRKKRRRDLGKKTKFLNLNVGSQGKGLLLHSLEMKGAFEVTFTGSIDRMSTRSDLVFVVGKGGLRFGNQFVKGSRGSFRPVKKGDVDRSAFEARRPVIVRLLCGNGKLSAFINGAMVGQTSKLKGKLDGKIGLFATDMSFYLSKVEIKGEINKKKL